MKISLVFLVLLFAVSCGVKGRPQPPNKTPYIGRGEPTFSQSSSQDSDGK